MCYTESVPAVRIPGKNRQYGLVVRVRSLYFKFKIYYKVIIPDKNMKKLLLIPAAGIILFVALSITPMIVLSGSMQPYMNPGDIVIVYNGHSELRKGDVITFRVHLKKDTVVTHRIVGFEGDRIITKGDNNRVEDDFNVTAKDVIGKPVALVPLAGYVVDAIHRNNFESYVITVLVPSLYIIASEVQDAKKGRRKPKKRVRRTFSAERFLFVLSAFTAISYALASPQLASLLNVKCIRITNTTTGYIVGKEGISEIIPVFWTVSAGKVSPVLSYLVPLAVAVFLTLLLHPVWFAERKSRVR